MHSSLIQYIELPQYIEIELILILLESEFNLQKNALLYSFDSFVDVHPKPIWPKFPSTHPILLLLAPGRAETHQRSLPFNKWNFRSIEIHSNFEFIFGPHCFYLQQIEPSYLILEDNVNVNLQAQDSVNHLLPTSYKFPIL